MRTASPPLPRAAALLSAVALMAFAPACATTTAKPDASSDLPAAAADPLAQWTLSALPDWTDKYAREDAPSPPYFRIDLLIRDLGLSRAQAVEVQNLYRDRRREAGGVGEETTKQDFDAAVSQAREGHFERFEAAAFEDAKFIVVFDLDATLYDQHVHDAECADYRVKRAGKSDRLIALVPGWQQAFETIRRLGGVIAIFSANLDAKTLANMEGWTWEGKPLTRHPDIKAILTNSHLIMQSKAAGRGATNPLKGRPIRQPSKDLRLFNEDLSKVIIVDDNPLRLFQPKNTRWFRPFRADRHCAAPKDTPARLSWGRAMPTITEEITSSVSWMEAESASFAQAYLPYTITGQLTVSWLMEGAAMSRDEAVAYVRANPDQVDKR